MYIDLKTLDNNQGFKIFGASSNDQSGYAIGGGFDINKDGLTDFAVTAWQESPSGRNFAGAIYVVYGSINKHYNVNLLLFNNTQGFKILGAVSGDYVGYALSKAGDFNNDGIDDLILGAPRSSPLGRDNAGTVYIIYGKNGGYKADIDLSQLNIEYGFQIFGEVTDLVRPDFTGSSVSNAGDINNDGINDIVIGAYASSPVGRYNAGLSYVIYGRNGGYANIDLSSIDYRQGFKILGAAANDQSGLVSGFFDLNIDGISDIVVGATQAYADYAGASYVIYGKNNGYSYNIDLSALNNSLGFQILGASGYDRSGYSVSNAGDVNSDGKDDIIVSAPYASPLGRKEAGITYVIYGKLGGYDSVYLSNFQSADGFRILGAGDYDHSGHSVSGIGDVNNDGIDDIIISAPDASFLLLNCGISYVIYGKKGGYNTDIDLSQLDITQGFSIIGENQSDRSGFAVRGAGDINNDGIDDIIVSAPLASPLDRSQAGVSYIIFGNTVIAENYCMLSQVVKFVSINPQDSIGSINLDIKEQWCNSDSLFIGDFNGDGKKDLLCSLRNGENYVMLSQGKSFLPMGSDPNGRIKIGVNDKWCSKDTQELHVGDFNNDKKSDLLCRVNVHEADEGSNYVMLSTGIGFEPITNTTDGFVNVGKLGNFCFAGSRLVVGNFDGQGGDDLFCNNPTGGSIVNMLMVSNGTSFVSANANILGAVQMGQTDACQPVWCIEPGSKIMTGDFNGDGKADLLCNANGINKIMLSQSGSCDFKPISTDGNGTIAMGQGTWPLWCDTSKSTLVTADVDGDALSDLVCNDNGVNQIMLCKKISNNNYRFDSFNINNPKDLGNTSMAGHDKWCTSQSILAGDINGDTLDDLWCNQGGNVLG